MTKAEFVRKLAQETGLAPADASKAVEAFLDIVREALKNGEDVQFAQFGKFSVAQRAARQGVNPREPGKSIEIPARKVPKFTPSAKLKELVNPAPPPPPAKKGRSRKK